MNQPRHKLDNQEPVDPSQQEDKNLMANLVELGSQRLQETASWAS